MTSDADAPLREIAARIVDRGTAAGVTIGDAASMALARYLEILARWNRTINLTALRLEPPDDGAIDRLIVEPWAAVRFLGPDARVAIDVGSGGGSPALPLKIAVPELQLTLVESRGRKAAFLREAVRHLSLEHVRIENCRLEALETGAARPPADVMTLRAVRLDEAFLAGLTRHLKPGGRLLAFVGPAFEIPKSFPAVELHELGTPGGSRLLIFVAR
jgi:16S rRNA (guanine527-N7)-methyltransferase